MEAWREVRVFISSTLRDMQAERGYLVKAVLPRLREKLLPYRATTASLATERCSVAILHHQPQQPPQPIPHSTESR